MAEVPFTIMVRDVACEVSLEVTTSHRGSTPVARFTSKVGDRPASDYTLEGLYAKLMDLTKRAQAKVKVPFSIIAGDRVRTGVITGIHNATHKPLVRWDDNGKTDQISDYNTIFRPLTEEEGAEIRAAARAMIDAQTYSREITKKYELGWRNEVEQQLSAGDE
jgi:hypothetical protein